MNERNYKNLHLDRANLKQLVTNYLKNYQFNLHKNEDNGSIWRLEFCHPNEKMCLINIYLNKDGTSTILYKQGQNQEAGKVFADYLYDSINPDEFISINMKLINIPKEDFESILNVLDTEFEDISVIKQQREHNNLFNMKSTAYNDSLTLTHHNNGTLQIQGKPLTCYKRLVYHMSALLDLKGLEMVLMRQDSNRSEVLNIQMAEFHLKKLIGEDTFERFPRNIKSLLLSSFCIKFSSPKLPDYTMLLYPEFRALEGMLKRKLLEHGLIASECEDVDSFGGFFTKTQNECFEVKQDYQDKIPEPNTRIILCDAYAFFNKHRNSLFHMNEYVNSSRMISDINEMNRISNIMYSHLKSLI